MGSSIWRGTDMCPPTSTVHHTQWKELSYYRDSLNNREPSPTKALENSFWLDFSGLLPQVSLSVWLLFYIYVCHHLGLLCCVTTGPLEWEHTNRRKPKTDGELLDWQWDGYPPWVFWICCTNWILLDLESEKHPERQAWNLLRQITVWHSILYLLTKDIDLESILYLFPTEYVLPSPPDIACLVAQPLEPGCLGSNSTCDSYTPQWLIIRLLGQWLKLWTLISSL